MVNNILQEFETFLKGYSQNSGNLNWNLLKTDWQTYATDRSLSDWRLININDKTVNWTTNRLIYNPNGGETPDISSSGTSGDPGSTNPEKLPSLNGNPSTLNNTNPVQQNTVGGGANPPTTGNNRYEVDLSYFLPGGYTGGLGDARVNQTMYDPVIKDPNKPEFFSMLTGALPNGLDILQAGVGIASERRNQQRSLDSTLPLLMDPVEHHRTVHGDFGAIARARQAAAQMTNQASRPLTSDGNAMAAMQMLAQMNANQALQQGYLLDDLMKRQTAEEAWKVLAQNAEVRNKVANANKAELFKTISQRATVLNLFDQAQSLQIKGLLAQWSLLLKSNLERRDSEIEDYETQLRNFEADLKAWDYIKYDGDDAADFNTALDQYKQGLGSLYIASATTTEEKARREALILKVQIAHKEARVRARADASKYVYIHKDGAKIYKSKLIARQKDNDRAAKSIDKANERARKERDRADKQHNRFRKYFEGGTFLATEYIPTFATSTAGAPRQSANSETETQADKLQKEFLKSLNGLDGLESDINAVTEAAANLLVGNDYSPYSSNSTDTLARNYIKLLNLIAKAKFNRKEYDDAFAQLKSNGGLYDYAISADGYVYCKNAKQEISAFTADEVISGAAHDEGFIPITNNDLLGIRKVMPDNAFDDKLLNIALNGIGMQTITEQISKIVLGLGSTETSELGYSLTSNNTIALGINYLLKAILNVRDASLLDNISLEGLYLNEYLTESLAEQASMAIEYIFQALPDNAKTLLKLKGGGDEGAVLLVTKLVGSKTSSKAHFKTKLTEEKSTTGSGSKSSKDLRGDMQLDPVSMLLLGYGEHLNIRIQTGASGNNAILLPTVLMPITDKSGKSIGIGTLDDVANSSFAGALDFQSASMGGELIDPMAFSQVAVDGTALHAGYLPVKITKNNEIVPDLGMMERYKEALLELAQSGLNNSLIDEINAIYLKHELPILYTENGEVTQSYQRFGIINGTALNSAFRTDASLSNYLTETVDENKINNTIARLQRGRSEADRLEIDEKSWFDDIFGGDYTSVYEGTIFIPMKSDFFTFTGASGKDRTVAEAELLQASLQAAARLKQVQLQGTL